MPEPLVFDASALTDPGWRFRQNQDAVLLDDCVWSAPGSRCVTGKVELLVGVADGAAFAPCAAKASRMALKLLASEAAGGLGPHVARRIQRHMTDHVAGTRCEGMSSTLAAVRFSQGEAHVLSVGDSRVYRWREGKLLQVTVDHTVARRMLLDGSMTEEEATQAGSLYNDLDSALIASSLEDRFDVFHERHACQSGDLWLCCSDGITAALSDADLLDLLERERAGTLEVRVESIIAAAKRRHMSDDNLSLILVAVR